MPSRRGDVSDGGEGGIHKNVTAVDEACVVAGREKGSLGHFLWLAESALHRLHGGLGGVHALRGEFRYLANAVRRAFTRMPLSRYSTARARENWCTAPLVVQ